MKKTSILIVDDLAANIFALEQMLRHPDRRILSASGGKEALSIALNEEVDLVMLDVQMPGMDGFEVAQILKSGKRTGDIPIIFVTAAKKEHYFMMKGFEQGGVDYLYKPLDPEITEAKVAVMLQLQLQKKELREKNQALEKYALQINNAADVICIIDLNTLQFSEINHSVTDMLGYTPAEMKNTPLRDYMEDHDWQQVINLIEDRKEYLSFELQARTKDGGVRALQWNVVCRDGLWFANIRDVSEIRRINIQLQKQSEELKLVNKELESFSYSVSHDLRAPLRAIEGFSNILEKSNSAVLDDNGKRYLNIIRESVSNMERLISDLLRLSKVGRARLNIVPLDLNQIISETLSMLKQANGESHEKLTVEKLPTAMGDPGMIRQVYQNLLSNAIKYSSRKKQPEITAGSYREDDTTIYYVKDNGAGFNMEYADKLFEVFHRLHNAEDFEGTGIGLALVQRIITRHGGKIWAESAPGKGATFYFTLPGDHTKK